MHKEARLAVLAFGGLFSVGLVSPVEAPVEAVQPSPGYIASSIEQWNALRTSSNAPFESYASFILNNRNWPGETDLRRKAERQIVVGVTGPGDVVRFFSALPPLTPQGHAAYALALTATGQSARAAEVARTAWAAGPMPQEFEQRLLSVFGNQFRAADHDRHVDALLDGGDSAGAQRLMSLTSPERRALYEARLALRTSPTGIVSNSTQRDPGFVYDLARSMNRARRPADARQLMAQRPTFDRPPSNPEAMMELMVELARGAANDGQSRQAYEIASKVDDLFPVGTDVSQRSYGERDEYTNLTWLAGQQAMRHGRSVEAMGMFDRYGRAAASLQTRAKGFYWAARAATAAGQPERARQWLEQAAAGPDQFYGLLALERLGRTPPPPAAAAPTTAAERSAFERRSLVQAIRYLGAQGRRGDQLQFIRALSGSLDNDRDRTLAAEFGRAIGRLDMGVWAAREARSNGDNFYARPAFPEVSIPPAYREHWAAAHGIMRQESSFERSVVSPAGARGMMQLMPATAAHEARELGVPYSLGRLTEDADYNILLGSHHLTGLMDQFGNNLVLVAVAYNAGAGRVPQWIARNGDPRGSTDVVQWIEDIPFSETRNYVQRVVENAMVYDLMRPGGSRSGGRVSYFLGQRSQR